MTPLKKAVTRRSEELMRDRSKFRRIVVTLYPAGFIGLRLEKCRREETLSMRAAFEAAVQTRVMHGVARRRQRRPRFARQVLPFRRSACWRCSRSASRSPRFST
jgi:hypothetical protein